MEIQISLQVYVERYERKNLDSYVIKLTPIDCDKDTYDILNYFIVKPLNDGMKIIMNEDMFGFLCGMKTIKYSKNEDVNESSFRCVKKHTHVF